jgi:hypothetical protein
VTLAEDAVDAESALADDRERDSVLARARVRRRAESAGADRSLPPSAASARRSLLASAIN